MSPRVVLGVCGGIAAYKSVEVLRGLVQRDAEVQVVLTRGAREFITPMTFAVLSRRPVHIEVWGSGNEPSVDHVALADWADLLLVAPATAHTMGKFAQGLADDFLSTYFLSHRKPVLLAPAMESAMWGHAAVIRNREILSERGVRFVGPASGALASGHVGIGRMEEPEVIVEEAWRLLSVQGDLAGMRLLVTAGPTELPVPRGVRVLSFETAADLHGLLVREFPECDGLAMAAAVADFIPQESAERLHREEGDRTLRLAAGQDILASLAPLRRDQTVVAFAAETDELEKRAAAKMEKKGADLIVVNDVGRRDIWFDAADNEVLILTREGGRQLVSRRSKRQVADEIWDAFLSVRKARGQSAPLTPTLSRGERE